MMVNCDWCKQNNAVLKVPEYLRWSVDFKKAEKSRSVLKLCIACFNRWVEKNVPKSMVMV